MRRLNIRLIATLLVTAFILVFVVAGCTPKEEETTTKTDVTATKEAADDTKEESTEEKEEVIEPLGKFDPAVDVKVVNLTNSTVQYRDGESADNNVWIKHI